MRKKLSTTLELVVPEFLEDAEEHGSIEENEIFHLLLQAQPRLRDYLCGLGDCEQGVPVRSPSLDQLKKTAR